MSRSVSDCDFHMLIRVSVPVHQEFFNRLVEAYPREDTNILGSVRGSVNNRARQLEMFLLRNFAEFPIHFQKRYPDIPLLTDRFRRNVGIVLDTLGSVIEGEAMRSYITGLARCPAGECCLDRDMSNISTARLWAVEMVRLEGYLIFERDTRVDPMATLYDTYTLNWLRGGLADFLGVQAIQGVQLVDTANSVFEELLA